MHSFTTSSLFYWTADVGIYELPETSARSATVKSWQRSKHSCDNIIVPLGKMKKNCSLFILTFKTAVFSYNVAVQILYYKKFKSWLYNSIENNWHLVYLITVFICTFLHFTHVNNVLLLLLCVLGFKGFTIFLLILLSFKSYSIHKTWVQT